MDNAVCGIVGLGGGRMKCFVIGCDSIRSDGTFCLFHANLDGFADKYIKHRLAWLDKKRENAEEFVRRSNKEVTPCNNKPTD